MKKDYTNLQNSSEVRNKVGMYLGVFDVDIAALYV